MRLHFENGNFIDLSEIASVQRRGNCDHCEVVFKSGTKQCMNGFRVISEKLKQLKGE